ncbi:MAG: hypothetical protein AAFY88_24575, partial [Acidobacteriota bacterium]
LQLLDEQVAALPTAADEVDIGPAGQVAAAWIDGSFLRGERFDINGASLGAFEVEETEDDIDLAGVDLGQSDAGFALLWRWRQIDGDIVTGQLNAQRFNDFNQPVGGEIFVRGGLGTSGSAGFFFADDGDAIEMDPIGDFAVRLAGRLGVSFQGVTTFSERIELYRFAADGSAVGDPAVIYDTPSSLDPAELTAISSAAGADGQVAVAWNDEVEGLLGRRLLGDDAPESGPEVPLSDRSALESAVALASPGAAAAILSVSDECAPGSAPCVYFRALRSGPGLIADGFEKGDLSGWCRSVP